MQHLHESINFSSNKLKQADRHVIIISCLDRQHNECTFYRIEALQLVLVAEKTHHSTREGRDHCHCQITNFLRLVARSGIVFLTILFSDVKQKVELHSVSVNKPGKC